MAMLVPAPYQFNPNNNKPENIISGEEHVLTAANAGDFHMVVPTFAPFFSEGVVLKLRRNGTTLFETLQLGRDYYFTHKFKNASLSTTHPIFGSISFTRRDTSGLLKLDYATLGGDWLVDRGTILRILTNKIHNPRVVYWDQVAELPYRFPVTNHDWNIKDMYGGKEIVAAILDLANSLKVNINDEYKRHLMDFSNPHKVTAEQTGAYTKAKVDELLSLLRVELVKNITTNNTSINDYSVRINQIQAEVNSFANYVREVFKNFNEFGIRLGNAENVINNHTNSIANLIAKDIDLENNITNTRTSLTSRINDVERDILSRRVNAGNGLVGGGILGSNPTISLGTPKLIEWGSTNHADQHGHSHEIRKASNDHHGIVRLTDNYDNTDGTFAPSSNLLRVINTNIWNGINAVSGRVTALETRVHNLEVNLGNLANRVTALETWKNRIRFGV